MADFENTADEILAACSRRKGSASVSPYESSLGTFKREAYKLLRRTIAAEGKHNVIKAIVRNAEVEPARLHYRDNRYHFGLLAIDPYGDVVNAKRLSLWSRQLTYADRHEVPTHFLLGFLWQSGSASAISRKLQENYREPWFKGP